MKFKGKRLAAEVPTRRRHFAWSSDPIRNAVAFNTLLSCLQEFSAKKEPTTVKAFTRRGGPTPVDFAFLRSVDSKSV